MKRTTVFVIGMVLYTFAIASLTIASFIERRGDWRDQRFDAAADLCATILPEDVLDHATRIARSDGRGDVFAAVYPILINAKIPDAVISQIEAAQKELDRK